MLGRAALILAVCAGLMVAGCGSDSSDDPAADASPAASAGATGADAQGVPERKEPKVAIPRAPAPKQLVVKELIPGTGAEIEEGDEAVVHYVMANYGTRSGIDSSWARGKPFTFTFGGGEVVEGWNAGMEGMRVGGRRELIVPPDLAYGAQGDSIVSPEVTLVLVVDLLEVNPP